MALSNREFYQRHALLSAERIEQLLDIEEDAETPGAVDMCKKIRTAHDMFQGLLSSRVAAMSEALDVVPLQ